jgi:hypothetical protein
MKLRRLALPLLGAMLLWASNVPAKVGYGETRIAPCGEPCGELISGRSNVLVEIVVEGRPAVVYRDGAYRWIEGRRGERFAFRVTNRNGFPVGVILSADGQSLTADGRASSSHPAYVIDPYDSLTVSVWREDLRGGRELVFTSVDSSLAARKGDRRNIGVLGVLVWQLAVKEPPRPVPMQEGGRGKREGDAADKAAGGQAPSASSEIRPDDGGIGVGAGNRVSDPAYMTNRYRRVRVLDQVAIYYDDRRGLERAGVNLDQHRDRPGKRRGADPFPDGGYRGVRIP